ncbi:hypothetical protein PuT2_05195 [Pusillimonas sp. T2]|nr:hypothetical protein PuT2_05195 [Pusillimonas sp. T2]
MKRLSDLALRVHSHRTLSCIRHSHYTADSYRCRAAASLNSRAAELGAAEGKTKGGGTCPPVKPVCTWGERGTSPGWHRAVELRQAA